MDSRGRWWLLLAAMVIGAIALARGCSRPDVESTSVAPAPSPARVSPDGQAGDASTQAPAPADPSAADRARAMYAAAATLQRYLAAVGSDDRGKADAFWTGGRPPANSGEADLRSLKELTSMRIESGTPVALDSDAVPSALEIPVQLRVSVKGGAMRKYEGRYRLRRKIVDDGWEITSASTDAVPGRQ